MIVGLFCRRDRILEYTCVKQGRRTVTTITDPGVGQKFSYGEGKGA